MLVDALQSTPEPPAECDGCEQYAVMHAEIALALDIHDETDAHGLQELILKKLRAMAEPTWPHPYGYIRSLISEAVERAEIDLMAIGHGPDGQDRTAAMKDLENWKAKLQDAWIHGDLEVRRATQPPALDLRTLLDLALGHIDMPALKISHPKDHARLASFVPGLGITKCEGQS
jgi:hypothetical protein